MPSLSARADAAQAGGSSGAPFTRDEPFEAVVRRHKRQVTLTAYRITRHVDDAHDVTQQVFMQLYRSRPQFSDQRAIERWLYVVTRNTALSFCRRRERDDDAAGTSDDKRSPAGPEETVLRNERDRQVRATVALLPAPDRNVIELRHFESMPADEVARVLGISLKRVKHDVERARLRLRRELQRRGLDLDLA